MIKILIVDDDPLMRNVMEKYFTKFGCEIETSSDGINALEKVEEHRGNFDAIITDYNMHPMNGFDFYYKLKEKHPKIDVFLMTGEEKNAQISQLIKNGLKGYFPKPLDFNQIRETII